MKKNNLESEIVEDSFLLPLHFLLQLSVKAYEKYMKNKIYLHALNIRKANRFVYDLIIDQKGIIPEQLQPHCIELLNHYDCWMLQFTEEEKIKKPSLTDEFIFYHADEQVGFPRLSEAALMDACRVALNNKVNN